MDDLIARSMLLVLGLVLLGAAAADVRRALGELRLHQAGGRAQATVSAVSREWVVGETRVREWVHVSFRTEHGEPLQDVRLQRWTPLAPRVGTRVTVSYDPDDPTVADRALLRRALGRLLVAVPTAATAVLLTGAAVGLVDRWLGP